MSGEKQVKKRKNRTIPKFDDSEIGVDSLLL